MNPVDQEVGHSFTITSCQLRVLKQRNVFERQFPLKRHNTPISHFHYSWEDVSAATHFTCTHNDNRNKIEFPSQQKIMYTVIFPRFGHYFKQRTTPSIHLT